MRLMVWINRHRAALMAIAVFLAACAGPADDNRARASEASGEVTERFFTFVYDQIADRYVQPVSIAQVATAGLNGLNRIDSRLEMRRIADRVEARDGAQVLTQVPAPRGDDARGWATTTYRMIQALRPVSPAIREASGEAIYQAVMEGALTQLDAYSRYANQEQARESRASREGFGGIGVVIDTEQNDVRVRQVTPDSPASRAGVQEGDRIVEINRETTTGMTSRDVVRRLRGAIGAPVEIAIARDSLASPLRLSLTRALIVPNTVTYRRDGNVAVIRLTGFNQRTTENLAQAVRQARQDMGATMQGIVLDLRGNLGGLLDQSITVANLFLPSGEIVSTRGRHRQSAQISYARGGGLAENTPLVLLVNGSSASASEIVAAALQDNGRAIVIGTVSFGKGSVQTVVPLPNEGELFLTWARFFSPSGYPLQDLGVLPLICTSGGRLTANQVIDNIRAGRMTSAQAMSEWRGANHDNQRLMQRLRATCAPENTERDLDVEVARRLLGDPQLYARALRSARAVAQARQ